MRWTFAVITEYQMQMATHQNPNQWSERVHSHSSLDCIFSAEILLLLPFCFAEDARMDDLSGPFAAHPPGAHRAAVREHLSPCDWKDNLPARQRRQSAPLSGLASKNSISIWRCIHLWPLRGWIWTLFFQDLTVFSNWGWTFGTPLWERNSFKEL